MTEQPSGCHSPGEVTALLEAWGKGDRAALDRLMPIIYGELRRLAHRELRREDPGRTLSTTAVVNEASRSLPVTHDTVHELRL